jgi:putative methyltransferase (TIGR04325 family)
MDHAIRGALGELGSVVSVTRRLLPPLLWDALRRLRASVRGVRQRPEWEYVPEGWARAQIDPNVKGWNVAAVSERHRLLWPLWTRALEGTGTLGVDFWRPLRMRDYDGRSIPTDLPWAHNAAMAFAYVLALTARNKERLSILDLGGGVGQFSPLTRALLPDVEIDYHVVDTPVMCSLGRELNPVLHFYEDESWQGRKYDFVLASGALQCTEQWQRTLEALAKATAEHLLITRIPIVFGHPSFVVLQRAEDYGFETEFLGWFVNREELLDCATGAGVELLREFVMLDETPAHGAPEQATYRGFLFRPARATASK